MPNTLAHIGVHWPLSRWLLGPQVDPRWILAGCVIPDLPWIFVRVVHALPLGVDPYALRTYGIVLASLAVCGILVAGIAVIARHGRRTALTLGIGCALHLLLDATQIKWGNGVHLLAPASWNLTSFGWFWPESLPTIAMTVAGVGVAGWLITRVARGSSPFRPPRRGRLLLSGSLIAIYCLVPLVLADGPQTADNHGVATLAQVTQRTGKPLDLDRAYFHYGAVPVIETYARERIEVTNPPPGGSGTMSVSGVFESPSRVRLDDHHRHRPTLRNGASLLGLLLIGVFWIRSVR